MDKVLEFSIIQGYKQIVTNGSIHTFLVKIEGSLLVANALNTIETECEFNFWTFRQKRFIEIMHPNHAFLIRLVPFYNKNNVPNQNGDDWLHFDNITKLIEFEIKNHL